MNRVFEQYLEIVKIFKILCCSKRTEEAKFVHLIFLITRGLRELTMLNEIDDEHGLAHNYIRGYIDGIF
jgi:hypothetical protein